MAAHVCGEGESIVRELAERGPFLCEDGVTCAACYAISTHQDDPANHEPSCLWRRSRELYPEAVST